MTDFDVAGALERIRNRSGAPARAAPQSSNPQIAAALERIGQRTEGASILDASLYSASFANADDEARKQRLARVLESRPALITDTRSAEAEAFRKRLPPSDTMLRELPGLAGFLSDGENASIAHDDMESLARIERLFADIDRTQSTNPIDSLKYGFGQMAMAGEWAGGVFNRAAAAAVSPFMPKPRGGGKPDFNSQSDAELRYVARALERMPRDKRIETAGLIFEDALNEGRFFGGTAEGLGYLAANPMASINFLAQMLPSAAAGGGAGGLAAQGLAKRYLTSQLARNAATMAGVQLGANTLGTLGPELAEGLNRDMEVGAALERAGIKAGVEGTVNAIIGGIPLPGMGQAFLSQAFGQQVKRAGMEFVRQGTGGALGAAAAAKAVGEPISPAELFLEFWGEGLTAPIDISMAALTSRHAQARADMFRALGDEAKGSKLYGRMPEKFRELVERLTKDGPLQHVRIPAQAWQTYFQGVQVDPGVAALQAGALNYPEAVAAGTDILIPMATYAEKIAPSEHHEGLLPDMRLRDGEMTLREAQEFEASRDARAKSLKEEVEAIMAGERTLSQEREAVRQDMLGQLLAIGESRENAEAQATMFAAGMHGLVANAYRDMTPEQRAQALAGLVSKYDLRVNRPMPDVLTQRPDFDVAIDPMLDMLRTGSSPGLGKAESLLQFLRRKGGISDDRGDIASMEPDRERRPFQRKLLRPEGLPIDKAREAAAEAGYLPTDSDINDLLALIDQELRGTFAYPLGSEGVPELTQALDQLARYIDELGIDLAGMDNPAVRRAMQGIMGEPPAEVDVSGPPVVTYNETEESGDEFFQKDLFGDEVPDQGGKRARAPRAGRNVAATVAVRTLETIDEVPGLYGVETALVAERTREIHSAQVTTPQEAAQALAFLSDYAVEHMDALVTDASGKPLAIVGSFKGALAQASVYPSTLVAEAVRIKGAANIWLGHNHPSGVTELSRADLVLSETVGRAFSDLGISVQGIFAIAGSGDQRGYQFEAVSGARDAGIVARPSAQTAAVAIPVVERVYRKDARLADQVTSPTVAEKVVPALSRGQQALVFLDNQNTPVAVLETRPAGTEWDWLTINLAISKANAAGVIVSNPENVSNDALRELKARLAQVDVRVLDSLSYDVEGGKATNIQSAARRGVLEPVGEYSEAEKTEFMQSATGRSARPLASIAFTADRKFRIDLLEGANLSSFLHETGHFWLEVLGDLAEQEGVSQQIKDDYAALLKWFGVASRAEITREHHEQFARANEAYLMEGKAPSKELRGIFRRFRDWLKLIYREVTALNVTVSDEVRNVFDRIYATDEEIAAAQSDVGPLQALFADARAMGLSQQEFDAYRESVAQAGIEAAEVLQLKLMRELRRQREADWKEKRETVKAEVAAEVDAQPAYRALATLRDGKLPDGTAIKLSRADLVARYGEPVLARLPKVFGSLYSRDGGIDTGAAAELLGFASADALIEALGNLRPRRALIEAETDARMAERFGELRHDEVGIADAAREAVLSDHRAQIMRAELVALNRELGGDVVPPLEFFREAAAGIVGQTKLRDLSPAAFLSASRKAGDRAFKAMVENDRRAAFEARRAQLLNNYLWREASDRRKEAERFAEHMRDLGKLKARERIGKAGGPYLDQIDALAERYEFRDRTLLLLDRRESLKTWVQGQRAMGFEPAISDDLMNDSRVVNYRLLTIDELRALRDAVASIEKLARYKNLLLANKKRQDLDATIGELVTQAQSNLKAKPQPLDKAMRSFGRRVKDGATWVDEALLPIEQLVLWLDGGQSGPWHDALWNPIADAQTAELDMDKAITLAIEQKVEEYLRGQPARMADKIMVPALGQAVTRQYLISIAMNVGNASNMDKMLRGHQWSDARLREILAPLDRRDWKFVQDVWDILDGLRPAIGKLQKDITGIEPEWVAARPFTIRTAQGEDVTVAGGYYPVKYDPQHSQVGQKQQAGDVLGGLLETGYEPAITSHGWTFSRKQGFARPLLLDFEYILGRHLSGVIKDLSHRPALIDASRLLRDQRVRAVLQDRLGEHYEPMFMNWLRYVANERAGGTQGLQGANRFFEGSRSAVVTAALGYKLVSMLAQFAGLPNSIEMVGARPFAKAFAKFLRHPVDTVRYVTERSGEMRHRYDLIDRDMREQMRQLRGGQMNKARRLILRGAFLGIAFMDRIVATPTWLAGYSEALRNGVDEANAIHAGDAAVRRSQGSAGAKDLSAFARQPGPARWLTMFYTPFAAQYARQRNAMHLVGEGGWKYMPEAVYRMALITMIPAVVAEMLTNRGPKECEIDDAGCLAYWAAVKMGMSTFTTIPVLRDAASAIEQRLLDTGPGDARLSPVIDAWNKVGRGVMEVFDATIGDEEWTDKTTWDALEAVGYMTGTPLGQPRITLDYLYDLLQGDVDPQDPGELLSGLIFRRKAKENP